MYFLILDIEILQLEFYFKFFLQTPLSSIKLKTNLFEPVKKPGNNNFDGFSIVYLFAIIFSRSQAQSICKLSFTHFPTKSFGSYRS